MEFILSITEYFNSMSAGNDFIAASLMIWVITVSSYLLRNVPKYIFYFLKRNLTTSMEFNNAGFVQERNMFLFMK